jgi:membrane-associated phospholipid phosphatase
MRYIIVFFTLFFHSFLQSQIIKNDSLMISNDSVWVQAQKDSIHEKSLWQTLKYDARNGANGFLHTFIQPTKWKKKDFLLLGGTILGTGILYVSDEDISSFARRQNEKIPHMVNEFGFRFGKPLVNYGLTGGIYAAGLITKNEKIRYTGVLMITSASVSGLIQQTVKTIAGRARPITELGSQYFKPFDGSPPFSSFPSGHTALSVTTCYALSKQFKNPWIKGGFYALGMVSPVSRIWTGAHWASDVFLSTAMSIAIVESVDSYLKKGNKYDLGTTESKNKISWRFRLNHNQIGLVGVF